MTTTPTTTHTYCPAAIGENILAAIAPGWLVAGRVAHIDSDWLEMSPAIWLESPRDTAAMTDLCSPGSDTAAVVNASHPIPTIRVARGALIWVSPTPMDVSRALSAEILAVRKSR